MGTGLHSNTCCYLSSWVGAMLDLYRGEDGRPNPENCVLISHHSAGLELSQSSQAHQLGEPHIFMLFDGSVPKPQNVELEVVGQPE